MARKSCSSIVRYCTLDNSSPMIGTSIDDSDSFSVRATDHESVWPLDEDSVRPREVESPRGSISGVKLLESPSDHPSELLEWLVPPLLLVSPTVLDVRSSSRYPITLVLLSASFTSSGFIVPMKSH